LKEHELWAALEIPTDLDSKRTVEYERIYNPRLSVEDTRNAEYQDNS
jgi:hypothetical protein